MGETLTLQQLRSNSYHLAIRSSLLAIQSTLSLQETMLQSQHATFTDIKSTITSQNSTLQKTTKTLAELFSKISSFQPPPAPPTPLSTAAVGSTALAPTSPKSSTHVPCAAVAIAASPHLILSPNHFPQPPLEEFQSQNRQPQSQQQLFSIHNADPKTISQAPNSYSPMLPALKLLSDRPAAALNSSSATPIPNSIPIQKSLPEFPSCITTSPTTCLAPITSHIPQIHSSTPIFTKDTSVKEVNETMISIELEVELEIVHHIEEIFDEVVKSHKNISIFNNLTTYDDVYLSYDMAKNSHIDRINKLKLLVGIKLDQPMKWKESEYKLILVDFVKCTILLCESKVLVFDPGGTFKAKVSDLEDKVDFEGMVMIGNGTAKQLWKQLPLIPKAMYLQVVQRETS